MSSKRALQRLESIIPGYEKPILGILAAPEIGLPKMRAECPNFDQWLMQLESFGLAPIFETNG
jgi:hypothetical protein